MGRHATSFEKECLCFRCPLPDCRSPCPFGMDRGKYAENVDDYLLDEYFEREKQKKHEKVKRKNVYNHEYYLKNKEQLREYKRNQYIKNKLEYLKRITKEGE